MAHFQEGMQTCAALHFSLDNAHLVIMFMFKTKTVMFQQ